MKAIRLVCEECREELRVFSMPDADVDISVTLSLPMCPTCSKRLIDTAYAEGVEDARAE